MEIRDDVAHALIRQRLAVPNLVPTGVTKIGAPRDDDGSQALIAYERQITGVGNLLPPLLMTGNATRPKNVLSVFPIACRR